MDGPQPPPSLVMPTCTAMSRARARIAEFAEVYHISKKMLGASSPILYRAANLFLRRNLCMYDMPFMMALLNMSMAS